MWFSALLYFYTFETNGCMEKQDMDTDTDADLQSKNDLQMILLTTTTNNYPNSPLNDGFNENGHVRQMDIVQNFYSKIL